MHPSQQEIGVSIPFADACYSCLFPSSLFASYNTFAFRPGKYKFHIHFKYVILAQQFTSSIIAVRDSKLILSSSNLLFHRQRCRSALTHKHVPHTSPVLFMQTPRYVQRPMRDLCRLVVTQGNNLVRIQCQTVLHT
jgi:hypothetical protein